MALVERHVAPLLHKLGLADTTKYEDEEEPQPLVQQAVSAVVAPVRILTSRTAIKAYLSTILFLITSTILLTISSTAFGFFYYRYIPQINLERVLYLDYGQGAQPHATAALDTSALISQQAYDVELILNMPRTPANLEAGNFMLDLSLLGPAVNARGMPDVVPSWLANISTENVQYHSRRPAILPYSSPVLSLSHTLLYLPWHFLNLRDLDSSNLVVPMFELVSFQRGSRNVPTHARLEVQSSSLLQIYTAKLAFRAKFQGIRYLVYNYRIAAFVVFTATFYMVSVTSMALAWALISMLFSSTERPSEKYKTIKQEDGVKSERDATSTPKIKTEDETESSAHGLSISNLSDTAAQFPTGRGQMPLSFPGRSPAADVGLDNATDDLTRPIGPDEAADDEDEEWELRGRPFDGDSGIGTSMESERTTSGVVRRRSSKGLSSR